MSANPEQPVLDAIAELVDWQLEEGRRRELTPREGEAFTIGGETMVFGRRVSAEDFSVPYDLYRDHFQLEPGQRVGWTDADGVVHVSTVREHREDPPGSNRWTITVRD